MRRVTTIASVEAAKPVANRQVEYPDAKVPGLALRVSPGGNKSWTLRYRTNEGEQRRLTLGRYPSVSLSKARELAHKAVGRVAEGVDPAKEKRSSKAAAQAKKLSTVATLIESYFEDAARGRHKPNGRPKRTSTLNMERDYFERAIKPRFGPLPVVDLTRHELQRFLDDMGRTAPASARHCRNVIRQAFNYGIRREVVEKNPAQLTELPVSLSRERVLTDDELRAIWGAANAPASLKGLTMSDATGLAICFAMLTLQRGGEVCGLHAREIDREGKLWTIPGTRTKNHRTHAVPLSDLALDILDRAFVLATRELRATNRSADKSAGFAFPSRSSSRPITRHAFTRAMKRMTNVLKIPDATPHDFRRTGSTNITSERIGIPRFVVSRVLNQISDTGGAAAATGVYDRNEYLPEKRRALGAWSALLQEIVIGRINKISPEPMCQQC
jgi:integrase